MTTVRFYYGDTVGEARTETFETRAAAERAIGYAERVLGWLGIITAEEV
jgi:hypothetical protein